MELFIENLKRRYAVQKFDPTKKVSQEEIENIIEVFRLSASSFGLQPWKLFIVTDEDTKAQIMQGSYYQEQIGYNSHLLVFAKMTQIDTNLVTKYIDTSARIQGIPRENLAGYEKTLASFVTHTPKESLDIWAREQVFLALGNVMAYLASKHIDSCPIGGFDKNTINQILGLKEKGFESVVLLPIGYRSSEDVYAQSQKVRFDTADIAEIL